MFASIIALFATAIAHAGVKVTGLDWQAEGTRGRFVVTLSEPATITPEWDVRGGRFAMTLPSADIEKKLQSMVRHMQRIDQPRETEVHQR